MAFGVVCRYVDHLLSVEIVRGMIVAHFINQKILRFLGADSEVVRATRRKSAGRKKEGFMDNLIMEIRLNSA